MTLNLLDERTDMIRKNDLMYLDAKNECSYARKRLDLFLILFICAIVAEISFLFHFNGAMSIQMHMAFGCAALCFAGWMIRYGLLAKESKKLMQFWATLTLRVKGIYSIEHLDQFRNAAYYKDLKEITSKDGDQILKAVENIVTRIVDKIPIVNKTIENSSVPTN